MRGALAILAVAGCATPARPQPQPAVQLELPAALASDQAMYRAEIAAALDHVTSWFAAHELPVQRRDLVDHAVVFADGADARRGLAARLGVPAEQVPEGFSGTVIERTLYVVAPAAYRAIFVRMYPEHAFRASEYRALLEHEIGHRAHELHATRLFGSAEGMGPGWFFEGLALVAAGQFAEPAAALTLPELRDLIAKDAGGGLGYPAYARMVRSLAARFTIRWLVEHAGRPDFMAEIERGWR